MIHSLLGKRRYGELLKAVLFMSPALLLCILFTFIPFFRAIWLSFFIVDRNTFKPASFFGLGYYARIFNLGETALGDDYLKSILTTFEYALNAFRTLFTTTVAISVASASVIWSLIFNPNADLFSWLIKLTNSPANGILTDSHLALPAVAFMSVWTGLGFNFIIMLAGLMAIPQELYESTCIDGASAWKTFRFITVPLLSPTMFFLFIINTISCFQAFTQFKVMIDSSGPDQSTNVFVYSIFTSFWTENNYGFASAMSVILFFILLALSWAQFRLDRRVHYQ